MAKATWKNTVLAESDQYEVVEGNVYFPSSSLRKEFFEKSNTTTVCGWKGTASYYHVVIGEEKNQDAAWYYPEPKPAAKQIKDYIAFWKGITIEK